MLFNIRNQSRTFQQNFSEGETSRYSFLLISPGGETGYGRCYLTGSFKYKTPVISREEGAKYPISHTFWPKYPVPGKFHTQIHRLTIIFLHISENLYKNPLFPTNIPYPVTCLPSTHFPCPKKHNKASIQCCLKAGFH